MTEKFKKCKGVILLKFCFLWIALFSFLICAAQVPVIKTSVDRTNILIGEYIKYSVEASFSAGTYQLNWLDIPDSIEHFEVVVRGRIDTTEAIGIINVKQQITLTSFDSGENTLPQFAINFDPLSGDSVLNLFTDSLTISVAFSPMDSSKTFHDIKTIIEVKDEWPLWMWIALVAGIILLAVIVYYLVKHFTKKKKPLLYDTKLTPLEEAMQAIDQLQNDKLLANGETKQFHVKLSDIFKRFISRKTNRKMLNLTSSEMLVDVKDFLSPNEISLLANSLRMSDAVKFAKYFPQQAESEGAMENMKEVIRRADMAIINNIS